MDTTNTPASTQPKGTVPNPASQPPAQRPGGPGIIMPPAQQQQGGGGIAGGQTRQPAPGTNNRMPPVGRGGATGGASATGAVPLQPHSGIEEALRPPTRLADDAKPLPVADGPGFGGMAGKITAFGRENKRHEDSWTRSPNTTGQGAIHVKTFHCKLTDDALMYLDQSINEWLDAHPQYEVKFVSTSIGVMTGKLKEPALICQVWV